MTDNIEIELNKVCRTCLTASDDMKSLYEASTSVSETLADRLMSNTPLTCYSNDGLPTRMCAECITDLNRLCTFKSKCLKSEELLQNYASYLTTFYKSREAPLQVCWSTGNLMKFDENARNKTVVAHNYVNPAHILTVTEMKNELHHENALNIQLELDRHESVQQSTNTQAPMAKTPEKTALIKSKPFSCTVCSSSFSRKDVLRTHMRTHTGKKPYPCPVCNRAFRNKNNMTVHMRTHTGEKPYSCHQCDRSFTHKSDVKKHTRIHTGEKPYSCTVCGKSFGYTHHLKNHMRSHTGAKPYACKDCTSAFSCTAGLKYHMMTHTGVRPYECKLCDRAFYRQDTLTVHVRTHTGEKPFACTLCDKTFGNKTNVTAHIRTHTKAIPCLCSVCGLSFQRSDILAKHIVTHSV